MEDTSVKKDEFGKYASAKVGSLTVKKEVLDGVLVFSFVSITKDVNGEIVDREVVATWTQVLEGMPEVVKAKALEHGYLQKFGDALAGKKEYTVEECAQILDDQATGLLAGDWNKKGKSTKEKLLAVSEERLDVVLASNPLLASMDRAAAIALIQSLGLMKK